MNHIGENTRKEILSQPEIWLDTLKSFRSQQHAFDRFWQRQGIDQVIFTGCGSTYYLSLTAAAIFQHLTGINSKAYPASELALFPEIVLSRKCRYMLIPISRSGETSETLQAVQIFRQRTNGKVVAITCNHQTPLALSADFTFSAEAAQEKSIAQTRSFTSMAILAEGLAAHLAKLDASEILKSLPSLCHELISENDSLIRSIAESDAIQHFFFLGAGYLYGIACEAMLKMKEMSLSYSEAFHPLEFRHGPMSMISDQSLVVGLISTNAITHEFSVLQHMQELGARILALTEDELLDFSNKNNMITLKTGLPPWAHLVLYLPPLQLLAFYRALHNHQDPDRPHNLTAVVTIDNLNSMKRNEM